MAKRKKKEEVKYPDQQEVFIHKYTGHRRDQYFTMDNLRCNKAMRVLNGNAFKLYVYLCQNRDGSKVLLSGKKYGAVLGMPKRSYVLAKQELVKRRYLIQREDGNYDFYNYQFHVVTEQEQIINEIIAKDNALAEQSEK